MSNFRSEVGQENWTGKLDIVGRNRGHVMGAAQSSMRQGGADDEAAAEAAAEMAAAMSSIGAALRRSAVHTNLHKQQLLAALDLEDDAEAHAAELNEQLKAGGQL